DRLVGFVHLANEFDDIEPELGWHLRPEARGKGYATEAARVARDWGFTVLPTFVSYVHPENDLSQRVAVRLNATRDPEAESAIRDIAGDAPQVWRHRPDTTEARP
ncbi:MAG: GNAT family N-acetyltransferase, partial [Pseudomonadota bacterium]